MLQFSNDSAIITNGAAIIDIPRTDIINFDANIFPKINTSQDVFSTINPYEDTQKIIKKLNEDLDVQREIIHRLEENIIDLRKHIETLKENESKTTSLIIKQKNTIYMNNKKIRELKNGARSIEMAKNGLQKILDSKLLLVKE